MSTISGAISLYKRWKNWSATHGINSRAPIPFHVSLFLESRRISGPTAALGAFNNLKWLETQIGFACHTDHIDVRNEKRVDPRHIEAQAEPLELLVWVFLETNLAYKNDIVTSISLTWLGMAILCLRFAHWQRSLVTQLLAYQFEIFCTRGKARDSGRRRRPYHCRAPRYGITGIDIGAALVDLIDRIAGADKPHFLLFDVLPARASLANCTEFSLKKMSAARFIRIRLRNV